MRAAKTVQARLQAQGVDVEWTAAEVAVYLKCSTDLIYLLCHRRQIPHRKINLPGRERPLFRFRKADIDQWRDAHSEVITACA